MAGVRLILRFTTKHKQNMLGVDYSTYSKTLWRDLIYKGAFPLRGAHLTIKNGLLRI